MSSKETKNPKDLAATNKVPFGFLPWSVIAEVAVAMYEGVRKYASFNWRSSKVSSDVYISAALRHITVWQEGEDQDVDACGLSHLTKAIAGLMILRDAQIQGTMIDTRPVGCSGFMQELNKTVKRITEAYPEPAGFNTADGQPQRPYTKYQD